MTIPAEKAQRPYKETSSFKAFLSPMTARLMAQPQRAVAALLLLFFAYGLLNAARSYYSFKTSSGDFAIYEQTFFNTFQGRFMANTFEGGNHLALHFSPILVLLLPLMALFPSGLALIGISTFLLVMACWRWTTQARIWGATNAGLLVVLMLLFHGTLKNITYADFHGLSLLPLPMVEAFIAFRNRNFRRFMLWCGVIATIRESLFLVIAGWALIAVLKGRYGKWIWGPLLLAATHFTVVTFVVPHWLQAPWQPSILDYYQSYGGSAGEILRNLRHQPTLPFEVLFTMEKLDYLKTVLMAFLFVLPFFRSWWLPAVPVLMVILFSSDGRIDEGKLHYSIEIVLWFAFSVFAWLSDREAALQKKPAQGWMALVFVLSMLHFAVHGALAGGELLNAVNDQRYVQFREIAAQIPDDASLITPRYLGNHLAQRQTLYFLWEARVQGHRADYLLLEGPMPEDLNGFWQIAARAGPFTLWSSE